VVIDYICLKQSSFNFQILLFNLVQSLEGLGDIAVQHLPMNFLVYNENSQILVIETKFPKINSEYKTFFQTATRILLVCSLFHMTI